MRLLSLFSGIGAFEKALERLKIEYELVNYCEIDKYASKSYSLIHNVSEDLNLKDVTKIDVMDAMDSVDLITYGFPCQDISYAGRGRGFEYKGEKTRSGLFFDALRIIDAYKPAFAIAENVKALTGKKYAKEFETVLTSLEEVGYTNFWAVLNAKEYGIPQNRERVFIISVRNDIAKKSFAFPVKLELTTLLQDLLDDNVDDRFYLTDKQLKSISASGFNQRKNLIQTGDICSTLCARDYKDPKCVQIKTNTKKSCQQACEQTVVIRQVAQLYPNSGNPQAGRVYDSNGLSPTLDTCSGGNRMPKILDPIICASRGRKANSGDDRLKQQLEINTKGGSNTLTTAQKDNYVLEPTLRVRKLTPLECWRLMGFDDEDCQICIDNGISNTQLYKQAGNSIVVNVLVEIFKQLAKDYPNYFKYKTNLDFNMIKQRIKERAEEIA